MSIKDEWTVTEDRLRREAGSLGELLEQYRSRISPVLIGGRGWERLVERAKALPANVAAFPFGFELPLHLHRPGADLGVSVVGGTRVAAFFEERGRSADADASTRGIVRLLDATLPEESHLRDVVGRKMMLEYDIDSVEPGAHAAPGIFLQPAERPIVGDRVEQRFRDIDVVLDAIAAATGWSLDTAERRQIERLYRALPRHARMGSFGAFPARGRGFRLAMTGLRTTGDVMAFLECSGWSGDHSTVASTVSRLEERGAFLHAGVHVDIREGGLGPSLGLSLFTRDKEPKDGRYWLDRPRYWTALIDAMRDEGLAVPEKLSELAKWPSNAETLFCKSGAFVLLRGIHHIKLVVNGERVEQVKGYVFLLMCSLP